MTTWVRLLFSYSWCPLSPEPFFPSPLTGEGQDEGGVPLRNAFSQKSLSLYPSLRGREKKEENSLCPSFLSVPIRNLNYLRQKPLDSRLKISGMTRGGGFPIEDFRNDEASPSGERVRVISFKNPSGLWERAFFVGELYVTISKETKV